MKLNISETVALACPSFSGGGAERVMITLANYFDDLGYNVEFIVGMDEGPYKGCLNPNIKIIVLASHSSNRLLKRVEAIRNFFSFYQETNAKVLMSTIREFNIFITAVAILKKRPIRLVLREASTLDLVTRSSWFKRKVKMALMRFFYRKSDLVIANSTITKSDLVKNLQLAPEKIEVIYNPLKIDRNSNKEAHEGIISLVACGRLVESKNFRDLILVMPIILRKYPNAKLTILGDGPEYKYLESLVASSNLAGSVIFEGFVSNPSSYYTAADVFVQTSLWEGFGYVLIEAMACGTPVVAYDSKGAMREILQDGKYGKLVPVGDLIALSEAILDQIENPTSKMILGECVSRFGVDKIAKEYLVALNVV